MKTLILWASLLASVGAFAQTSVQMRAVPTVGELVSRVPVGSEAIQVLGKSAAGDIGPARTFRSVTGLPSGGTNVAHVFASGVSNVYWVSTDRSDWDQDARWWGAFPDDGVDDTTALQAAIDYCGVNSGAAVVYVPIGSYDLRSTLMVTNTVRLLGDHKDKTILKYYGTNYAIQIGGGTNFLTRGASLENLFVIGWADPPYDGSYALSNALGMVHVYGATRGGLKNVRVSNAITGSGILFDRRAWYFDVEDPIAFDCYAGINFQCENPGAGDLVNTINVIGGNLSGCDIGVLSGVTNTPSGTAERGIATLKFLNVAIESNRRVGMWLNQTEVAEVSTYWEANGRSTNVGSGSQVRLGSSADTNYWSVSGVTFHGNRFADTTNSVDIFSANNIKFDGNDHQGIKSNGVAYRFSTTNHFAVHINPNEFSRQNYTENYSPSVQWLEGNQSSVTRYSLAPVRGSYRIENSSGVFGDGVGSALLSARVHGAERFLMANASNGPVEVSAQMIGQTGFPGVYMRTDGTEGVFGGQFNSGTMPLALEMNTTRYLTLDTAQSVHPNRFVIGETNGFDKLTVYGDGVFGDPTTYSSFTDLDSRVAVVSTNMTEQIGFFLFGADGVNNRRAYMKLDLSVPEFAIGTGYSSVGDIPVIIRSATGNDVATFINSGVTIRNGAGLTIGAETITDLTGSGITIVGGALTATATPYTTFWPDLTNALVAGANVTLAYDTGLQKLTISSSGGGGGNAYTNQNQTWSATATNVFLGRVEVGELVATGFTPSSPIGVASGGTGATNAASARTNLGAQAESARLQDIADISYSSGDLIYYNGSALARLASTALGRSLVNISSVANGRDILEVGQLDQSAYGAGWDGVTNATATLNALYDKIQSLPGGSNNISSWNTNYFSVTGGYLDWIGPSGGSGGGVTWIGNHGLSTFTNASTSTNVLLASFAVTTNKGVTTDGRFLEGGLDLMLTNASSLTVTFALRTKVNGTTVSEVQRSMATATTPEFHTTRFRLVRESSTTAHLTLLGERWGGSLATVGYGTFGSSGGEDLIVATNIAWNWAVSNTLDMDIGMSWTGTPTTNSIGVQRISASLYNPGDGTTGGGSGTGDVVGPASSTDSVVALYDGTTGKLLKNGTLTEAAIATDSEVAAGYQPLDSDLTAVAGLASNGLVARTGSGTVSARTITGDSEISVTNGDGVSGNPTLAIGSAIARLASPALTGNPTAPTATAGDNDTSIATTAFVSAAVADATPYSMAEQYEESFTPFLGSTTTTAGNPFTLAAINGGATGTQSPVLGRSGLVKINSATTAYWSGGVAHSGGNSIGLTNVYSWKAEFHSACTNGVTQTIGFGDSTTTNAFTDGLFLAITNGTAFFSASEGGTVTTAGTSFAIPTNTFIAAVCRGTNEIAVLTLTTNGVAAWSESINSANIPLGSSAVGVNVRAFVTSGAFTNAADLLILNYLGHRAATK